MTEGPKDWRYLACGVDTLDVGLYVAWDKYKDLFDRLLTHRESARTTNDNRTLWERCKAGPCTVYGTGRRMYMYHLGCAGFHVWIAASETPGTWPNVRVSIGSRLLWQHGVSEAVALATKFVEALGGRIERVQPSRCDLAADFAIPDGLDLAFLLESRVCRSRTTRHFMDRDRLQTFYVAKGKSRIQARIYDKVAEIRAAGGSKRWFFEIWDVPAGTAVWRVEFQARRELLKEFGIESVQDLVGGLSALWRYAAVDWLSFRLHDDSNTKRRTVHPWWQAVRGCDELIGPESDRRRNRRASTPADLEWYIARAASMLPGLAAIAGLPDLDDAINALGDHLFTWWRNRDWEGAFGKRRIDLSPGENEGGSDVPF